MLKRAMWFGGAVALFSGRLLAQEEPATEAASEEPPAEEASASAAVSFSTDSGTDADADASASDSDNSSYMKRYAPTDGRVEIGAFTGFLFVSSGHNLRNDSPHRAYEIPTRYMVGGRLGWYPSKFIGLEAEYMHARGAVRNAADTSDERVDFNSPRAQLVAQIGLWSITPFLVLGGGVLQSNSRPLGPDTDGLLHFGVGLKAALGESVALRLDLRENMTDRVNEDYGDIAWHEEAQLGLAFNLDRPAPVAAPVKRAEPDGDRDTVPDGRDECPNMPALTANGCPPDTDGDGVFDPDDHCPREKGIAPDGCPDRDSDKDGIPLPCDLCPEEKGVQPDGCPVRDTDGDGILDDKDKCPKEPETANGFEDADGCPDEVPKEVAAFTGVIQGIEFDRAKATIRNTSVRTLSKAVDVLKKHPSVRVEISGHTSSEGDAEFNQKLSEERAAAVKAWLVDHGIESDRIETRGAGPSEPIADNKTAAGRAKNRRIEFKLLKK